MSQLEQSVIIHTTFLAQAYGSNTYGCGTYENQVGCETSSAPTPGVPNTGMLLAEPSFVIPGSLLLAILIALISTTVAKIVRRKKHYVK
jgi:hypothetical protein